MLALHAHSAGVSHEIMDHGMVIGRFLIAIWCLGGQKGYQMVIYPSVWKALANARQFFDKHNDG